MVQFFSTLYMLLRDVRSGSKKLSYCSGSARYAVLGHLRSLMLVAV